jgi:predicted metal-dependent hydrolase
MCRSTVLRQALANSLDEDAAVATLKAALENGDVVKWRAGGCRTRYGLTASGIEELDNYNEPIFSPADESALREVIEVETKKANPDRDVVGWVNRRLATLEGESDG